MAYLDARGANLDFDVAASVGIKRSAAVTADGSAYDLTGCTILAVVKDDKDQASDYGGEYGTVLSYSQTITTAASGLWTFAIPAAAFRNKEGGRLSYEVQLTNGENDPCIMWGYLNVLERG